MILIKFLHCEVDCRFSYTSCLCHDNSPIIKVKGVVDLTAFVS